MTNFVGAEIVKTCEALVEDNTYKVPISESNLETAFEQFNLIFKVDYSSTERVSTFLTCISRDDETCYTHPKLRDTLVVDRRNYSISQKKLEEFFTLYERGVKPSLIDKFNQSRIDS